MKAIRILAASLSLFAFASQAAAQDAPNPKDVKIAKLRYSGSGCPKDSASVNISPDLKAFTVTMSQYEATIDNARRAMRVTKNCDIAIDLKVPDGWSFMVYTVDYRGYVGLTEGATADIDSKIRFNGIDPHSRLDGMTFTGPADENYHLRHTVEAKARRVSACKGATRHLAIKSDITVTAKKGASALMSVDSIDGELNQTYWIAWQRCKK